MPRAIMGDEVERVVLASDTGDDYDYFTAMDDTRPRHPQSPTFDPSWAMWCLLLKLWP